MDDETDEKRFYGSGHRYPTIRSLRRSSRIDEDDDNLQIDNNPPTSSEGLKVDERPLLLSIKEESFCSSSGSKLTDKEISKEDQNVGKNDQEQSSAAAVLANAENDNLTQDKLNVNQVETLENDLNLHILNGAFENGLESWKSRISSLDEGFYEYEDEEWCNPVTKILQLPFDHESWQHAHEILEPPSPKSRKIADEARSIAARHIIDRLSEECLLGRIQKVAPRLRSAVELLSKPDADYVYPKFQFVVNHLRRQRSDVYSSIIRKVGVSIPEDMKPSAIFVSLAKWTVENEAGELEMNWGKFVALLGLCGCLAIESVHAEYAEGVVEVVDAFGLVVEKVLGNWILGEGGGWEGFIERNVYQAWLSPVPRTILICALLAFLLYHLLSFLSGLIVPWVPCISQECEERLWYSQWYGVYPKAYCPAFDDNFSRRCFLARDFSPFQYVFVTKIYDSL